MGCVNIVRERLPLGAGNPQGRPGLGWKLARGRAWAYKALVATGWAASQFTDDGRLMRPACLRSLVLGSHLVGTLKGGLPRLKVKGGDGTADSGVESGADLRGGQEKEGPPWFFGQVRHSIQSSLAGGGKIGYGNRGTSEPAEVSQV